MELTWYGTAGLLLREGDTAIAFDPFGGIAPGDGGRLPEGMQVYRTCSDIFVTHGHFDHICHIPALCAGTDITVHCTSAPARTLRRRGIPEGQLAALGPGWQGTVGPFTLRAYPGRHCRFDFPLIAQTVCRRGFFRHPAHLLRLLALNLGYPQRGEILFYELVCGGVRVQIMGSLGLAENVDYPTGADVLILPFQGRSDLGAYALPIVRRLAPQAVLLDHYDDTFAPMTGPIDPSGFIQAVETTLHIPCCPLEPGRTEIRT